MDDEPLNEKPDMTLKYLAKQDLYALSVGDLDERIENLKAEISRCEAAKEDRGSTRDEAEKLFKF
ncbi:DUF1192 domain-containing protein [Hyphococcus flavus]|uniref:DUF1192 domain-containing protein n=1 Tax=Hyphococcus flavus TaxID=1866326 RepID=A0AAE9ZBB2_9PROT|nr:DUF1192 domain-containing protein [Hyphococcus flavus]WDI31429.1 DUF1192 domain-containing protein [Hyphococcus flavus]